MIRTTLLALTLIGALTACGKKAEQNAPPPSPTPAAKPEAVVTPADVPTAPAADSPEAKERAHKQAALDYATMEDGYINDARGQWATAAKASSSFGDAGKETPESHASNTPWQATGSPNGSSWNNDHQDIGFDWLELSYGKPVKATEVRVVSPGNEGVESINKIELIDTNGAAHTLWSGLSDEKEDQRGPRSWFVRKTAAGEFQTKSVKLTFANNVATGYKEIDAVQLIGE